MKIVSDDGRAFIHIDVRSAYNLPEQTGEDDNGWHVDVELQASSEWFSLRLTDVTIYRDFIEQFLSALRALEERRQGSAKLVGVNYENFELRIYSSNERGHMAVELSAEKYDLSAGRYVVKASTSFSLDPGSLPQVLSNFEAMLSKLNLAKKYGS